MYKDQEKIPGTFSIADNRKRISESKKEIVLSNNNMELVVKEKVRQSEEYTMVCPHCNSFTIKYINELKDDNLEERTVNSLSEDQALVPRLKEIGGLNEYG